MLDLYKVTANKEDIAEPCTECHKHSLECIYEFLEGHTLFKMLCGWPLLIKIYASQLENYSLRDIYLNLKLSSF